MQEMAEALRVLGDETRLRLLRILMQESLNVGELTRILGLAQPTVSKHLGELKKAGFVQVNRSSGFSYYRAEKKDSGWLQSLISTLQEQGDDKGDLVRLSEILSQRQELSEAGSRFVVPGRSWVAWSRALGQLIPKLKIADFGCGDGAFSVEMTAWAEKVYAIDSNPNFLDMARKRGSGIANLEFLQESMESVSLAPECVDVVTISQALHYVDKPARVLQQAYRILRPSGKVLVLDLLPHREKWVRKELKHQWMGFSKETLHSLLAAAGFDGIKFDTETKQPPEPFRIIIATGIKPNDHPSTH